MHTGIKSSANVNMKKNARFYIERISSIIVAIILLQTLFYKFTAAEESVYIFSTLHMEPWGRIMTGVFELIAGGLLVFRRTSIYGSILALGIISGAILSHIFILGIIVQDDGGKLFMLAVTVFAGSLLNLALRSREVKNLVLNLVRPGINK